MLERLERDVGPISALDDDLRRSMYLFVREHGRPASREEVADAVGVSRKLAAFHLDKLVDRGLLVATYARPPGRTGRGAGRSAKYYGLSDRELDVSIPERNYDVIGSILLGAISQQEPGEPAAETARRVAHDTGEEIGRKERERLRLPPPGAERTMRVVGEVLARCGYEPSVGDDGTMSLRSCPFHALAQRDRDIVCGLNRELVDGVVSGLGNRTVDVELAPAPGRCCVQLRPPGAARADSEGPTPDRQPS
jgi:predicted ArsR family transcriptional regulator